MRNRGLANRIFDVINVAFMCLVVVMMTYPFIYVLCYSLSNPALLNNGLLLYPKGLSFSSYLMSFRQQDVLGSFLVSTVRTIIGPLTMLVFTAMAGYVLTNDNYVGVRFFRKYFVFTMYFSGGIIPTYVLIKSLDLTNNFLVYILPMMISAYSLILVKTYIESLPRELEESAFIDGANEIVIFFKIILPLCLPIAAAITLFSAINHWNSFMDNLLYNSMNRNLYTLQFVLYNMITNNTMSVEEARINYGISDITPMTLKMAVTVISILPILIIYPTAQKYFVSGLLVGSIKA